MEHKILFSYCVECGCRFVKLSSRARCRQCVKLEPAPEQVNSTKRYRGVPDVEGLVVVGLPKVQVQYVRVEN